MPSTEDAGAAEGMIPSTLVITGPTASGKGTLAFDVAKLCGAEIVSLDSMKVYREVDIATAKPLAARREAIPHHLIDIVDPDADFSIAEYLPRYHQTLLEIARRGRRAVIAGGTALYLKAIVSGMSLGAPPDWDLRRRLAEEAASVGVEALHGRLRAADPGAAARIDPADLRRIVRALEVIEKTGRRISGEWNWGAGPALSPPGSIFAIERARSELYARIERRVDRMMEMGLLDEARRLYSRDPPLSRSASQAIGYKEIRAGLDAGLPDVEIAAGVKQATRRFAKRQLTWFRKLPIEWLEASDDLDPERAAIRVLERAGWT
jgi:tRNA dimethylallyltransferase